MRILLSVEHPAWAHQFRYVIRELEKKGHTFKVVAINKDRDLELLDAFGILYDVIYNSSGKNIAEKGIIFLWTTIKIFLISCRFKPDLFIGRASPMMAINSFIFRKPHIVFEDTEHSHFCLFICKLLSTIIITPSCFKKDLGKKQVKIDSYKELFYLHPKYFKPDPGVLKDLGIIENEKYVIIRFIAWDAHHDIGQHGILNKVNLVKEIEAFGRVLISSEITLPEELEQYRMKLPPEKFHDALYYATLHISEGGTTVSEAAVLGTPAIYVSSLIGSMGNFFELETKYILIYNFKDDAPVIEKGIEILKTDSVKQIWRSKQRNLIIKIIDPTEYFINIVNSYLRIDEN